MTDPLTLLADLAAEVSELRDRVAHLEHEREAAEGSPWLSIAEAANYLRCSERKVHHLIAGRGVRSSTVGRRRLLHRDDLDGFMTGGGRGEVPTAPPRRRVKE